ncbi:MAG: dUTP diphosphatase [Myxococcales bacterium]|nr:dUTP diphosphatase [Myxococcales bacterium]
MGAATTTVRIEIARLAAAEGLPLPSRATSGSAGYDLCAAVQHDLVLAPGDRVLVPTGYRFAIPPGYEGQIRPRSGLALSHGILVPNAPGTIDSDYRGELRVILLNAGEKSYSIRRGDRIAQLVIAPVMTAEFSECDQLEATDRGERGFGHSGRDTRGSES